VADDYTISQIGAIEFKVAFNFGIEFGTHETRTFQKATVSAFRRREKWFGESGASLMLSQGKNKWGKKLGGWETSVTIFGQLGYDWFSFRHAQTWYFAKSWSEFGMPSSQRPEGDVLSKTNQRIGTSDFNFHFSGDTMLTITNGNDSSFFPNWGDGGDKYRSYNAALILSGRRDVPHSKTEW
jgi:hypothetical protein